MNPRNRHYQVKEGDSLSKVAFDQYGDAMVWPQIALANRLPHSGLILIGMTLDLPSFTPESRAVPFKTDTIPVGGGGAAPAQHLSFPGLTFTFKPQMPPFTIWLQDSEFEVEVTLTGEITLWKKGNVGSVDININNNKISASLTKEYKTQFAQFVSDTNFYYDAARNRAGLEGGLAVTSGSATPPWSPMVESNGPTIKFIQNPPLSVQFTAGVAWKFEGKLGYEISITQKPPEGRFPVEPQPALATVRSVSLIQKSSLTTFIHAILDGIIAAGGIAISILTKVGSEPIPVPAVVRQISYAEAAKVYRWSPQILR